MVSFPLHCVNWIDVRAKRDFSSIHKIHAGKARYIQHNQLISKIIKLYSLNDRYMISEVPYLSRV